MNEQRKPNFLKGAAILAAASVVVKIVSASYRIPLFSILDAPGRGTFQVIYSVFGLILALSTAGVPVALSRLVSSANTKGNTPLIRRYFTVALPAFTVVGIVAMLVMFFLNEELASLLGNSLAATGIQVLAPAAFFACIIAVYRGYAQGHEDMIPTAISQIVEVICKLAIGFAVVLWLQYMNYSMNIVSAGAVSGVTVGLGVCIPILALYNRRINRIHHSPLPERTESTEIPGATEVLRKIIKVSIPISVSASFMAAMGLIDSAIVLNRLQSALGYTELEASAAWGVQALGISLFTIPPATVLPISVSIIPAIAAALARKQDAESGDIMRTSLKLVNLIAMPAAIGLMVLASPILIALFDYRLPLATTILILLGAASFFACLQFITSSILQANGHERVSLITFPIGAIARFIIVYILSGVPAVGVVASSIGTLVCFVLISVLNLAFIKARIRQARQLRTVFTKPFFCALIMGLTALLTYFGIHRLGYGIFGDGRAAVIIYLALTILISAIVYIVLVILTRVVTKEDLTSVPKGEKLAKLLRVK